MIYVKSFIKGGIIIIFNTIFDCKIIICLFLFAFYRLSYYICNVIENYNIYNIKMLNAINTFHYVILL